jgi:hypothetical protein
MFDKALTKREVRQSKIGDKYMATVVVASLDHCESAEVHESHWYPTGEKNGAHEVKINMCPGIAP